MRWLWVPLPSGPNVVYQVAVPCTVALPPPPLPVTAIALSLTRFLMSPARYFSRNSDVPKLGKKIFLPAK